MRTTIRQSPIARNLGRCADAVVISLPADRARREHFFDQPGTAGIRVHHGVDCTRGGIDEWTATFDVEAFTNRYGRSPLPGEVGCSLSHRDVLREFGRRHGRRGDRLLVCEDDVRFGPSTQAALRLAAHAHHDIVVLSFASSDEQRARFPVAPWSARLEGGARLGTTAPNAMSGTMAYVVSRSAARRMGTPDVLSWLADDFVHWRDQGLSVARVDPPVAWHVPDTLPSRISGTRRPPGTDRLRHLHFQPRSSRRALLWFAAEELRTRLRLSWRSSPQVRSLMRQVDRLLVDPPRSTS